jgi:hypothetical protein
MADHPTTVQQVAAFISLVLEPIDADWSALVTPQTLEEFEINCIDLDLASGRAPESAHGYTLRPVSSSQVLDWLPLSQVRNHDYFRDVFEPAGRSVPSLGEAQVTRLLMECCILDEPERITGQMLMQSQTFWNKFP